MTLTNDYRLGVLNGQRGTIANIDPQRRSVTVDVRRRDDQDDLRPSISTTAASTTRTR